MHTALEQSDSEPWAPVLVGPFLERQSEIVLPVGLRAAVRPNLPREGGGLDIRRRQTAEALGSLLGGEADLRYRPDGKPETGGGFVVSSSHGGGVTFAVAAASSAGVSVACDVEEALERAEEDWAGLLGPEGLALARLIAVEAGESPSVAGTRVWGAFETLSKNGRARADLVLDGGPRPDRWVLLRSGAARIATFTALLRGRPDPAVFTMLTERAV